MSCPLLSSLTVVSTYYATLMYVSPPGKKMAMKFDVEKIFQETRRTAREYSQQASGWRKFYPFFLCVHVPQTESLTFNSFYGTLWYSYVHMHCPPSLLPRPCARPGKEARWAAASVPQTDSLTSTPAMVHFFFFCDVQQGAVPNSTQANIKRTLACSDVHMHCPPTHMWTADVKSWPLPILLQ